MSRNVCVASYGVLEKLWGPSLLSMLAPSRCAQSAGSKLGDPVVRQRRATKINRTCLVADKGLSNCLIFLTNICDLLLGQVMSQLSCASIKTSLHGVPNLRGPHSRSEGHKPLEPLDVHLLPSSSCFPAARLYRPHHVLRQSALPSDMRVHPKTMDW